ncbi:MAG: hypothetical protein LBF71_04210 [Campylobacteraceae bacterium]|jgi:prophage DNA circulation protein|nr:hypothetical protein [Campylobacteraceae bacterium]
MEKEFDILNKKLKGIKNSIAEIENFTHKQSELFEVLSKKFPNIEQFTNALKEAQELQNCAKYLQNEADASVQTLDVLSSKLNAQKTALNSQKIILKEKINTRRIVIDILNKIDDMDEHSINNLKKLLSGDRE